MRLGVGLGVSRHPGFSPVAVPGLSLWLRADLGTTIATGVSSWADQSGKGFSATQGTGTKQPSVVTNSVSGRKMLRFTAASSQSMATSAMAALSGASSVTLFVVTANWSGGGILLEYGPSSGSNASFEADYNLTTANNLNMNCNGSGANNTTNGFDAHLTIGSNTPNQWNAVYNFAAGSNQVAARYNRAAQTLSTGGTATTGTLGSQSLFLGGRNNGAFFAGADLGELLVYKGTLTAAQIAQVEGYLKAYWATV